MSFNGFRASEIAERLGISTITVSHVLNSPLGKAYLNGLNDKIAEATIDVRKELLSMNKAALGTLSRLLDPKQKNPASVQLGAAKDVLDRSGFKAPDKIDIDMTFRNKTDAEIDAEIAALEGSIKKTQYGQLEESNEDISETIDTESEVVIDEFDSVPEIDEEVAEKLNDSTFDPFNNIEK